MPRMAAWFFAVTFVVLAGCRAPKPNFNPWAPYGSTRAPAPPTSSYGTPDTYYPGSTPVVPGNGVSATEMDTDAAEQSLAPESREPVSLARHEESVESGEVQPPRVSVLTESSRLRIASPTTAATASTTSSLKLQGMPINDATTSAASAEPAEFRPEGKLLDITQLPPATTSAPGRVDLRIKQPQVAKPASTAAKPTGWKAR